MKTNRVDSLAQRMRRLKEQLRDAQHEHNLRESRRAYRAMRRAGLTAVDVEHLLAQMTSPSRQEVSDDSDYREAE